MLRHLLLDQKGAIAVEAAVVLPVFLSVLFFAIYGLGNAFASERLDASLKIVSDEIRFGRAQAAGVQDKLDAPDYYKRAICENMSIMQSRCAETISVEVQLFDASGTSGANNPAGYVASSTLVSIEASMEGPFGLQFGDEPINIRSARFFLTEPF